MEMKNYSKILINTVNEYADDYSIEEVLEILFPGMSIGEIVNEAYEAGIIPNDVMEEFLND